MSKKDETKDNKGKGSQKDKTAPKGRRGKRDYVGEDPDNEKDIEEETDETQEDEKEKEPGFVDKLLRRDRKVTVFTCPECQDVNYEKSEELQKHLEEMHGIILIPEDVAELQKEIPVKDLNKVLKTTKENLHEIQVIQEIQDKRIVNSLSKPLEQDPKKIISPLDANNTGDIYKLSMEKMATNPDLSQGEPGNESYYHEEITGDSIEVSMIKRFPRTMETIDLLNKLKMLME